MICMIRVLLWINFWIRRPPIQLQDDFSALSYLETSQNNWTQLLSSSTTKLPGGLFPYYYPFYHSLQLFWHFRSSSIHYLLRRKNFKKVHQCRMFQGVSRPLKRTYIYATPPPPPPPQWAARLH